MEPNNPLRIHCLEHVPYEGPGYLVNWSQENGHELVRYPLYLPHQLPEVVSFDWLVVMGGPMGVHDEKDLPWLAEEKQLIAMAISAGKTVVGICLGAQLIARVLGGEVKRHHQPEIGWWPVEALPSVKGHRLMAAFPSSFRAFHWHADTYSLPQGAIPLMRSNACENQAFLYNNRVLGLQFHLEVTSSDIDNMLANGQEAFQVPGSCIQAPETILSEKNRNLSTNQQLFTHLLNSLLTLSSEG